MLLVMNIQYTHQLSNEKQGQLNTLLDRYIPLQKYTVPKNEKLRYRRGLTERPQCPRDTKVRGQAITHSRPPQFSLSEREQAEACVVFQAVCAAVKSNKKCVSAPTGEPRGKALDTAHVASCQQDKSSRFSHDHPLNIFSFLVFSALLSSICLMKHLCIHSVGRRAWMYSISPSS